MCTAKAKRSLVGASQIFNIDYSILCLTLFDIYVLIIQYRANFWEIFWGLGNLGSQSRRFRRSGRQVKKEKEAQEVWEVQEV